jgi:hypothetical protein
MVQDAQVLRIEGLKKMKILGLIALALLFVATPALSQGQAGETPAEMGAMDSTDHPSAMLAHQAMSGSMTEDAHMRLTPFRPGTSADSARAGQLVADMRRTLAPYRDVRVAEAQGFRQFLPGVKQPVYHFTNWRWAIEAMFRFDPAKPTSLPYRKEPGGHFELVGAMYTAPARTTADDLGRRLPLSIARWHEHVNWCLPPRGAASRWREQSGGHAVFGPRSPIATRAACDSVGGRFRPRIFGWMVHVQASRATTQG